AAPAPSAPTAWRIGGSLRPYRDPATARARVYCWRHASFLPPSSFRLLPSSFFLLPSSFFLLPLCRPSPPRLDLGDVDILHGHRRLERALGRGAVRVFDRFDQGARRDLPVQAPLVFTPSARAFLTAVPDNRIPQPVGFGLIVGRDLERKCLVVLEL